MEISGKKLQQGSLLQLLLLHCLYGEKGSEGIVFQGGTALRWVYGGQRASEDLDFVSPVEKELLLKVVGRAFRRLHTLCLSQFGPGTFQDKPLQSTEGSVRTYAIFRPEAQRERIAVRIEIEHLRAGYAPLQRRFVLMELPAVFSLMREGTLTIPYSSSILTVETPDEILTDKIRTLCERTYLKGRDLFDIWFLHTMLNANARLPAMEEKLKAYIRPFRPFRKASYYLEKEHHPLLQQALRSDLRPFLPVSVYGEIEITGFNRILNAVRKIILPLVREGLDKMITSHA